MRIGRDALLSVGAGFAGQIALIASGVALARGLGVEGRGAFAILAFLLAILAQVGTLGIPSAIVHFLAKGELAWNRARVLSLRYGIMQSAAMVVAAVVPLMLLNSVAFGLIQLVATLLALPGLAAQQYALALVQGVRRFSHLSLLRVLPVACAAVSVAGAWIAGVDEVANVLAIWGMAMFLAGGVLVACAMGISRDEAGRANAVPTNGLWSYGLKGYLGNSTPFETFRLDFWAATLGGPVSAGIYATAQAFTNLPRFIAQGLGFVVFPVVSAQTAATERWLLVRRVMLWNGLACGLVCVLLIGLMPGLVPLFFGEPFVDAVMPSRLLIVGAFVASQRRLLGDCLRGLGQSGSSSVSEITTVAVFLAALAWTGFEGVPAAIARCVVVAQLSGLFVDVAFLSARYRWDARLR